MENARYIGHPLETLKADNETALDMLRKLFETIWDTKEIPEDWKQGKLIKLSKERIQELDGHHKTA